MAICGPQTARDEQHPERAEPIIASDIEQVFDLIGSQDPHLLPLRSRRCGRVGGIPVNQIELHRLFQRGMHHGVDLLDASLRQGLAQQFPVRSLQVRRTKLVELDPAGVRLYPADVQLI